MFDDYYYRSRTQLALEKDTPEPPADSEGGVWPDRIVPVLGDLHHRYERRGA